MLSSPTHSAGSRTTTRRVRDKVSTGNDDDKENVKRLKPGSIFFITVECSSINETIRSDFVSSLSSVVTYCVALEESVSSKRVGYHLHIFLEFDKPLLLSALRQLCIAFFGDVHIDVQACRSKKTCLKYITKEDVNCYYNCKLSSLHFNKRVYEWAKSRNRFLHTDPFVVEHRFCYRYLKKYFDDFKKKNSVFDGFSVCMQINLGWAYDCAIWWNNKINSNVIKDKQLYLWGPSNVGKSTLIERLILRKNLKFVFYPGVGKFFMQGFDINYHKIIVFEEFDIKYYCLSMLKRLLEGRKFSYPVKCDMDLTFSFCGPVIFVSNYNEIVEEALINRLLFVSAHSPFWEAMEAAIPKSEKDEMDTVSISSSDSEEFSPFFSSENFSSQILRDITEEASNYVASEGIFSTSGNISSSSNSSTIN